MSIYADAKLRSFPTNLRKDIEAFIRAKPYEYKDVVFSDLTDRESILRSKALCIHLAKNRHSLRYICQATGLSRDKALLIINNSKLKDFPIRTTRWEVA